MRGGGVLTSELPLLTKSSCLILDWSELMPSEYEPDVISLHRESYSCHVSRKQDLTEIHNSLFRLPLFDPSQIRVDLHAIIMQMKKIPKSPSPPASSVILEPGP